MSIWLWLTLIAALIGSAIAAIAYFAGPERVWSLFGAADLGPVTFENLERRSTLNDALACPTGVCSAETDILPPVFPVDAAALRQAMNRALMGERRLTLVAVDDNPPTDRYVQRSERMRFPDTVVVRYFDLEDGRSTIALYSRSQLGRDDMGVNAQRIERWLGKLKREIEQRKAPQ